MAQLSSQQVSAHLSEDVSAQLSADISAQLSAGLSSSLSKSQLTSQQVSPGLAGLGGSGRHRPSHRSKTRVYQVFNKSFCLSLALSLSDPAPSTQSMG